MADENNQNQNTGEGGGAGSGEGKSWLTTIPEGLREHEAFKSANTMEDVFKSHTDLFEKTKGAVRIPDDKSSPEDIKAFRTAYGVPESIEGYEIQKPQLPEGMSYDEVLSDLMLKTMHEAGAPKEIVHKIFQKFNEYQVDFHNKFSAYIKESNEKRTQVLKDLWKNDYDKKNKENFIAISKFAEKANIPEGLGGGEGFKKWITDSGHDTDPMFNFVWNRIYELVGDDIFERGSGGGEGNVKEGEKVFSSYQKM